MQQKLTDTYVCSGSAALLFPPSGAEFLKGRKCFCVHLSVSTSQQSAGLGADVQEMLA